MKMSHKKLGFIFSLLLLTLSLGACASSSSAAPSSSSQGESSISSESSSPSSSEEVDTTLQDAKTALMAILPTQIGEDYFPTLTSEFSEVTISMVSSHTEILTNLGVFTQPDFDTLITLTITLGYEDDTEVIEHDATALGVPLTTKFSEIKDELVIANTNITSDFTLPNSTLYGAVVTWTSSDPSYIAISSFEAAVVRPNEKMANESINLTANISVGSEIDSKVIPVIVMALTVTTITLEQAFTVTRYPLGADAFNPAGGALRVTLDDDSTKLEDVTTSMISGFDTTTTGQKQLTISYFGATTTTTITVYEPALAEALALGEHKIETFEDDLHPVLRYDNAQVPNSGITSDPALVLTGSKSLYYESAGNFACLFLTDMVTLKTDESYHLTFDYKILTFVDTVYFQLAGPNTFIQFGSAAQIGQVHQFEWFFSTGQETNLIQIFPGATVGVTSMIIDNFKIERISNETNITKTTLEIGDTVLETFGDFANNLLTFDNAPAPSSNIGVTDAIDGYSLMLNTNGNYAGIYLVPKAGLLPVGSYRITFDYVVHALVDTIYFQYYNNGVTGGFAQFGDASKLGQQLQFDFSFDLTTTTTVFHMFPGSGTGLTKAIIDNLRIERLTGEHNVVNNPLNEGEYSLETFGDFANKVLNLDNAGAPNTAITNISGIDGFSLSLNSPGAFAGIYLSPLAGMIVPGKYTITFDYIVHSLVDTIYFQYYDNNVVGDFIQFGHPDQLDQKLQLSFEIEPTSSTILFQMFPGGGNGTTHAVIDNFKIYRQTPETNVVVSTMEVGDVIVERFGEPENALFTYDFYAVPSSGITVNPYLSNHALTIYSEGDYAGAYLNPKAGLLPAGNYKVTFDYAVYEMANTIYFQYYNNGVTGGFLQFGDPLLLEQKLTFEMNITLTSAVNNFHMFPGGGSGVTWFSIDNLTIERLAD